jgi:hypothetical protein
VRNHPLARVLLSVLLVGALLQAASASGREARDVATVYVTNWTSNSVSRLGLSADGSFKPA